MLPTQQCRCGSLPTLSSQQPRPAGPNIALGEVRSGWAGPCSLQSPPPAAPAGVTASQAATGSPGLFSCASWAGGC